MLLASQIPSNPAQNNLNRIQSVHPLVHLNSCRRTGWSTAEEDQRTAGSQHPAALRRPLRGQRDQDAAPLGLLSRLVGVGARMSHLFKQVVPILDSA